MVLNFNFTRYKIDIHITIADVKMACIEFSSKTATHKELSNFWPAPFELGGKVWPTVEHYFQAQKFPGDPALQERIRGLPTPAGAKRVGRTKSPHFRADWDAVKEDIMLAGLRAKFAQNPSLALILKGTGDAQLREKSTSDSYWACGPNGCGRNRMGWLLHTVRKEI